jgi:hypothetical protein
MCGFTMLEQMRSGISVSRYSQQYRKSLQTVYMELPVHERVLKDSNVKMRKSEPAGQLYRLGDQIPRVVSKDTTLM